MAEYQVKLKNWNGGVVALFAGTGRTVGGLQSIRFDKRLRTVGQFAVEIDGTDERIDLFDLDYQVEIWRRDRAGGLDWYVIFEGFHRSDEYRQDQSGQEVFVSRGHHYNCLLSAEPIYWLTGTAQARKSGAAETVAKAYVDENVGPGATSPPRLAAGVMPGLTVEADGGTGATWSGGRQFKNLLDTLTELADFAPADFMVVGTGPATFEFQWRADQWGYDRTRGNAEGNVPVVFSPQLGNVRNINYLYSRMTEVNVCYVIGQGAGVLRRTVTRTSGHEDDSPWARRAVARDSRNTAGTSALNDKGDEVLEKQGSRVKMVCTVKQTPATRFGRDWDVGDLVTVEYRSFSTTQKIVGVQVGVNQGGEETVQAIMEEPSAISS